MRIYYRTSRNTGVSVGVVGGMVLLFLVAAVWFYAAIIAAAIVTVLCLMAMPARRAFIILIATLAAVAVLLYGTVGVTPWGLVAEAWRTVFGTNVPA